MLKIRLEEGVLANKRNMVKESLTQEESLTLEINHDLGAAWAMR